MKTSIDIGRWVKTRQNHWESWVLWQNGAATEARVWRSTDKTTGFFARNPNGGAPREHKTLPAAKRTALQAHKIKPPPPGPPCPPKIPYDEVRRPNKTTLCLPNGERKRLKKIGQGAFSEVYVEVDDHVPGNQVWAFTRTGDGSDKHAMADAYHTATKRAKKHLPAIRFIGVEPRGGYNEDGRVFTMPRYQPLRGDTPAAKQARVLKKAHQAASAKFRQGGFRQKRGGPTAYDISYQFQEDLRAMSPKLMPRPLVDAVDAVVSAGANYSADMGIEIARRNLATDKKGNLVLLDPLFDTEAIFQQMRRW